MSKSGPALGAAAAHPNVLGLVVAVAVFAAAVGVLAYVFATGRQRSARWRDRMIGEHGEAGYARRRRAWRLGTWGVVIAAACGAVVLQMVGH